MTVARAHFSNARPPARSRRARLRGVADVLAELDQSLTLRDRPDLRSLVNSSDAAGIAVQRWFPYREGYSPSLVGALDVGSRILDPFCGCGSTMLGAARLGRQSLGIDINPLATFAANVKFAPLTRGQVARVRSFAEAFRLQVDLHERWPLPALRITRKVFEPAILDALLRLRTAVEHAANGDERIRDFLLLAWIAILEDVGSYFKEGNGIKYRNRKRLKTGYVRRPEGVWQRERFGANRHEFVYRRFEKQLTLMLSDVGTWAEGSWSEQRVVQGNALELEELVKAERFDSVLFSPPYANRFDYFESMKVELWFGGFVRSYDDAIRLRKASLRSHLGADLSRPSREIEVLERVIALMDRDASSWRMGVPVALRGYFDDMSRILEQCRRVLDGGTCYIVVGNSAYGGAIVPTDALLAKLGLEAGFSCAEVRVVRHLTVAPQQRIALSKMTDYMRESIVVLR